MRRIERKDYVGIAIALVGTVVLFLAVIWAINQAETAGDTRGWKIRLIDGRVVSCCQPTIYRWGTTISCTDGTFMSQATNFQYLEECYAGR